MAKHGLTEKQEHFVRAYFETGNAGGSYRQAYDVDENARDNWIYVEACQLLDNPKIAQRLAELRAQAERVSVFTFAKAMEEYDLARELALKEGQAAAAVNATNAKVKLAGIDKPIKHELSGPDGQPIKTEEVGQGAAKLTAFLETIAERSRTTGQSE